MKYLTLRPPSAVTKVLRGHLSELIATLPVESQEIFMVAPETLSVAYREQSYSQRSTSLIQLAFDIDTHSTAAFIKDCKFGPAVK